MDLLGVDFVILIRIISFLVYLNLFVLFVCKYKIIGFYFVNYLWNMFYIMFC